MKLEDLEGLKKDTMNLTKELEAVYNNMTGSFMLKEISYISSLSSELSDHLAIMSVVVNAAVVDSILFQIKLNVERALNKARGSKNA